VPFVGRPERYRVERLRRVLRQGDDPQGSQTRSPL
jgi:hypothetical protein